MIENSSTSYFVYKGQAMGFEYDLLQAFAENLKVDLKLDVIQDFDSLSQLLENGKADIIAANLTITKSRKEFLGFSDEILSTRQVLVQARNSEFLISKAIELVDSTIHVRKNSSFYSRLRHLSDEVGGTINIVEVAGNVGVEDLMEQVSNNKIRFTVADEHVAKINKAYIPNLDIRTPLSLEQSVAWGINMNCPQLEDSINNWLKDFKKTLDFRMIYLKYYGNTKLFRKRKNSNLFTSESGSISPFDEIIKTAAYSIKWDWRIIASLIYQESGFESKAQSWTGAYGLMQLMPETAASYGVDSSSSDAENIKAGVQYIAWIEKQFQEKVDDPLERQLFVLAAYNVGLGHVFDAMRLAEKHGLDPQVWKENVEIMLVNKAKPEYYRDDVVHYGYCRGSETKAYVHSIMEAFQHYKNSTENSGS